MVAVWVRSKVPDQPGTSVPVSAVKLHDTVTAVASPALPVSPAFVLMVEHPVWPAAVKNVSTVAVTSASVFEGMIPARALACRIRHHLKDTVGARHVQHPHHQGHQNGQQQGELDDRLARFS
jgi:hypothetical protein